MLFEINFVSTTATPIQNTNS